MLFQFKLRPLEDIAPWGGDDKPILSWFSLTDGWYWWQVGSSELFRYSEPLIDQLAEKYSNYHLELPYDDYQIARFWEDLLAGLPAILDPVPDDLVQRIQNKEQWQRLRDNAWIWAEAQDNDISWDLQDVAFRWWSERRWNAGYLRCPPEISHWTQGNVFHLQWDNRDVIDKGIAVWDATFGAVRMPVTEFLEEVISFHERLMAAMAERVDVLLAGALRPEITVNLDWLVKEQEDRATWLQNTLTMRQQHQDWNEVRAAISTIERMCYNDGVEGP